jgi:hypothetical protein
MRWCCPSGHGCNAPDGEEVCALTLCREAAEVQQDAALALVRWQNFEEACARQCSDGERRFRRRAFERARDRALMAIVMRPAAAADGDSAPEPPVGDGPIASEPEDSDPAHRGRRRSLASPAALTWSRR